MGIHKTVDQCSDTAVMGTIENIMTDEREEVAVTQLESFGK